MSDSVLPRRPTLGQPVLRIEAKHTQRAALPEKPLPHSPEAERAFLGAILLDTAGVSEPIDRLEPTDFFLPLHQVIFRHMKQLRALGMPTNDIVLLHDAIGFTNELEAAGGAAYIASLSDGLPRVANVSHYAEKIKDNALARRIIRQYDLGIDKLLTANGNLADVLQEIHSAHIQIEFGRKQSGNLFRTAADLVEESNPAEFVVKPYILAGAVTELVAKIKAGKTTYALGEIVRQALDKGPVVYLTEQPPASFRVALKRAGLLGHKDLHTLSFNAVMGLDWPGIVNLAITKCREVKAILLVVDTLSHFAGLAEESENAAGAALTAMKPIQVAAAEGIAVLTVRHERKSGGELGDAGRGSSAFGGAADTLMALRRLEGRGRPTIRKIECISRFEGLPAEAVYEYLDGRYEYLGTESEISDREAEAAILGNAPDSEDEAKTLQDLLKGSETARTTGQRVAKRLVREGKLTEAGKGKKGNPFRYFVPEKDSAQTTHIHGRKESEPSGKGRSASLEVEAR